MSLREEIVGAVLAGGMSSRMGVDKAMLPIQGIPMISRVAGMLSGIFSQVVLLPGDKANYSFLQLPHIGDLFEGCGPLGGIHAALHHAAPKPVFVLACDLPFVTPPLVNYLLSHLKSAKAVVPSFNGMTQPLCAVYTPQCLQTIDSRLKKGWYGVSRALEEIEHTIIPITEELPFYVPNILLNINNEQEYREHAEQDRETS